MERNDGVVVSPPTEFAATQPDRTKPVLPRATDGLSVVPGMVVG